MQIDWITVAAQIVNFLILVWLLQRFLYRPLSRALKAREEEVNRSLHEAQAARTQAEAEAEAHRAAMRALKDEEQALLDSAREQAVALRTELDEEAHREIAARRAAWRTQLEDEKSAFLDRLRRRAGEAFVTLARRSLAEMADEALENRIAHVFARRLPALDAGERAQLTSAAQSGEAVQIQSSFPLGSEARTMLSEAVGRTTGFDGEIEFHEQPELECGIVLAIGSRHVGWTIGEHLDWLENDVARLLDAGVQTGEAP